MSFLNNRAKPGIDRFYRILGFVFIMATVVSCYEYKPVAGGYYNLDSLLDGQIRLLVDRAATLEKNAVVGEQDSHVVLVPGDSAAWAEELDIFRNLSVINKPVNRGLYIDSVYKDRSSNLSIRGFSALDDDLPLERLEIYYLNTPRDIRKIEATVREKNLMFKTKRTLRMDFRKKDTESILSAYSIKGGQKMLMGDSVRYFVSARISTPQN